MLNPYTMYEYEYDSTLLLLQEYIINQKMKKQHIVKDKDKLFKKLFISPSYCEPLDPPLLVSPDFINLLLQQSAKAEREYQIQIINDILNVFAQRPTNSLLLCAHDQTKLDAEKCILDSIVLRVLNLISSEQQVELYLERVVLMLSYYRISLRNFRKLTQWLSKTTYIQKFDPIKLMFIVRLIKLYYSKKLGQSKSPQHYFYIFGTDNCGIQPIQHASNELCFKNQLTIVLSFNCQGQSSRPYNLFLIKTEKNQQIGLTYTKGSLKITALYEGEFLDQIVAIKSLSEQVWYRLIINLNTSHTECIVDNQTYTGRALLKKQRQRKIIGCMFGRQFFGMIGNVLMSNKNIPLQKFDTNTYPYGIDSIDHLIALNKTSIPANSICSCLPFYTFEVRQVLHCFDVFHRNHSSISDNVVVVGLPISEETIQHMGGCSILLPLFYLARFYNKIQYPTILQDLLSIVTEIISNYNVDKLEAQFQETNFLQILGQHLGDIPHLQTSKSLNIILAIFKKFRRQETKLIFLHDVIWNLNVGIQVPYSPLHQVKQVEPEPVAVQDLKNQIQSLSPTRILKDQIEDLIAQYYKTIITIYNTEGSLAYKSMSFAQITYWAVQRLEANRSMIFACCLQHHLNQAVLEYQMKVGELIRLDASHFNIHYHYLEEILSNYLQIQIKKADDNVIEHFKTLLRLLLQKYSACFYVMVLKVIKRQIISFGGNKEICKILLDPKLQITSFLIFLSEKTINPDIISQILYILLFIYKHSSSKKKEQVIKFIVNLLKINQQMLVKITNPIKNVVTRIRKNSLPNLKRQEDAQQLQIKLRRTKSYIALKNKNIIKNSEKQRLSRIISRSPKPQKLSSHQILYNIIMNQLSNAVSQSQPTTQGIFYSEQSILILKQYYKIAQPIYKQSILLFVLASLQKNPQLKNLKSLTLFLLECLKQSIYTSLQQTKNLLTIFTCIFSQIITNHGSIIDYYSSIKYLKTSRIAISLVLPHVISKIIKLADMSQLCQLLMVCLYEMIQSTEESALEISLMVFCEINDKILKYFGAIKQDIGDKQKDLEKIEQCQLFNQVICQNLQKQINFPLSDPFQYIPEYIKQQSQNVDFQLKNVTNQFQISFPQQLNSSIQQVKVQQVSSDEINGIRNKLNIFSRKQRSKSKSKSPQQNSKSKKQNSQGSTKSIDSSNNKFQKQKNPSLIQYVKQLTALEIYIKLFFKSMQKLEMYEQKKEYKTMEEKQSFIRRTNSAQISYSYEFKSKQSLEKQFAQIMLIYFKSIIFTSKIKQKGFIKFILSYLLYKNQKVKQSTGRYIIKSEQMLATIILNTILPFMSQKTKDLHDISYAISAIDAKTIFVSYFTRSPFHFKFDDFIQWNKDRTKIVDYFHSQIIHKTFIQDEKFFKFFNLIDDNHDLLIVGFYQRNMQKFVEDYENLMTNFNSQAGFKNIQKLFDTENSAQQKTRITFLYQNQCRFRKYHYEWDKLWNKLRTYHQPYGFWMAQKYKDSIYVYPKDQIRNFKFQMSEYSSTIGMYPVLEAKILQPWTIVKDNRIKKNLYINSFSQMMKPSHIKSQKTQSQSQNNIFTTVWKGMLGLSKKNSFHLIGKQKVQEYDVVLISRSTKATGKMFIQNKRDLIFCYQGARQQDTHLSFQKFSLAFNRQTYQKWSLYTIERIRVHRYLLKYQALQVIFCDGRSVIFHFYKDDKEQFIKDIQKIQRQKIQANAQKLYKLNKVPFLMDNFFEYKGLDPKITQSWIKREISNLQYLIKLNRAASRGIFDLSQYMVVPWVVEFKKQKQPAFRDLSKTMGGLGSEQRKKIICEKYFTKDPFNPYPPFFFGTHYSSPGVVFNFLIRLSPFTEYCKHLQGGKFDIPDRLFSSIVSAWRSASQQVSDVRQLIPEMYYLPQVFINIDENYFGYTQNAQLINHVEIPPWGANNPYFFTSQLRQIMESQQISQKINQWIDLIFGYKQRGKQAEQNYNIYYYLTYQDHKEIQEQQDDVYVKSKQAQIVHFGQIPPQIFDRPHPKRNSGYLDGIYQLKITRSINLMNSLKQKPIGIRLINNELFICKRNQFEIFSIQSNPASLQKKKKFNFQKSMTQTYYLIKKQKSNVYLLQKPFFIVWGYMSNQFRIVNKNTGEIDQSDEMSSKILSLHVNKDQDLILIGSQSGILAIYQIQYGLNDIFLKKIGTEVFPAPIVHISQFEGFFTITFGNYSSIYKIHRSLHFLTNSHPKASIKFFRSFYNPIPLKASYIMGSPLYSMILIDNANIKSYSINGQFIKSINSAARYYGRFKDSQLHDVFYAVDDDKIICYSVPDLRNISILELPDCEQVIGNYIIHKSSIDQIGYVCE